MLEDECESWGFDFGGEEVGVPGMEQRYRLREDMLRRRHVFVPLLDPHK